MGRWSVNEFTTFRWSFEDDVRYYAEAGFESIGVWRQKLSDYGEEKGAELLRETGLSVSSLHWIGSFTGSDGRGYQDGLRDAKTAMQVAQLLGARNVVVHSGSCNGHIRPQAQRILCAALDALLPLAEEFNTTLVLKPIPEDCAGPWTFLHDFDAACRVVDMFDSPHIRLVFDTYYHAHDDAMLARLGQLVDYIGLVQVADATGAPRRLPERHLPGTGRLPLETLVRQMEAAGYRGSYELEVWGEHLGGLGYAELLRRCRDVSRRWYAGRSTGLPVDPQQPTASRSTPS